MGGGDDMMKRIVGCLLTHLVLMVVSYFFAELCGNAVNPAALIWFGVASSFFLFIGVICFIEAIMIAAEGMESRR